MMEVMKRLFIALMILEGVLLVVLALPMLHKPPTYDQAASAWREQRTDEALEAFLSERARRDRQVMIAFAAVAGLCANALALCFIFERMAADQPPTRRRGRPALSPRRRRMKRLAQVGLVASLAMMGGGGVAFARTLDAPATRGLHSLVMVLAGGVLAFIAVLAWMLTAGADQAVPVEPTSDCAAGDRAATARNQP